LKSDILRGNPVNKTSGRKKGVILQEEDMYLRLNSGRHLISSRVESMVLSIWGGREGQEQKSGSS